MIQSELQQRAHAGDREAFREIYETYSREVYALAQRRFNDAEKSREIVRQVFLSLYRELLHEDEDIDIPARVSAIADEEIRIRRIADGDLSEDTLKAQCALAEEPDTSGTMERIRRRMDAGQERDAGEAGSEEPAAQPAVPTETMQGTVPQARAKDAAQPELLQTPKKKKRASTGGTIAAIVAAVLFLVFLWLLAGILMDLDVIPSFDLGYRWFNEHIFDFFRI